MALIQPTTPRDTSASRVAEQRVREWTMHLDVERRRQEQISTGLPGSIHPYVAISRETGTGGAAIARRVAELLNWEVLHREILDEMAKKYNLPRAMLELVDESTSNWIVEIFGKWLDPRLVTHSEYIVHLGQLVLLAARHSSKVFVGRGAQFFLPAGRGLSVYVVAPLSMRIARIREIRSCSEADARRYIRETDQARRDLIKSHFNHDMGDPHLYDLVVNLTYTSLETAAALIAGQCRQRFGIA
ncbi:MAG: cytidylate kinase-like family protein [Pirellulaceae bacterium]